MAGVVKLLLALAAVIACAQESYDDAVTLCNDISMSLLSIETEKEEQLLFNYIKQNGLSSPFYATSGTRFYNKWMWSGSGQEFTHSNWGPGEPNYSLSPVCVYMLVGNQSFHWLDEGCSNQNFVICEQDANYCP